jgi:hypothetical protein
MRIQPDYQASAGRNDRGLVGVKAFAWLEDADSLTQVALIGRTADWRA